MRERLTSLLATGFGLGFSRIAPGSMGALLGVLIAATLSGLAWETQALVAGVLAILAIPICNAGEENFGRKDDRRIVADEYLTFPLCTIGLPWALNPWLLGMAFVVNRILDVVKPPPARQAQDLHGGLGIAADDIVSSLYALAVNHALWWAARNLWPETWRLPDHLLLFLNMLKFPA